uniref:transposase family protein n=1 Tax=Actinomadura fulvescens TaxID=46160 RepID=UPI003978307E
MRWWNCSPNWHLTCFKHCVNIQFLTDPYGELIWVSPALPGATHDLSAARTHGIVGGLSAWAVRSAPPTSATSGASWENARSCSTGTTPRSAPWASAAPPRSNSGTLCATPGARPAT